MRNKWVLIFILIASIAQARTVTLTVPPPTPLEPYVFTATNDATGTYTNYGVTMQFSPFIGFASGDLSGFIVKEIIIPLETVPVDSGEYITWPSIYEFPSGATGDLRYTPNDTNLVKDIILSESAIDALPSATGATYFPDCASPWFVVGDIDFQVESGGAVFYADGVPFGLDDSISAEQIEVKSATGQLYFTLNRPYLETESGEIRNGWIYYDGTQGVCLYCFQSGDWQDGIRFDPTISTYTYSSSYVRSTYVKENAATTNYGTDTSVYIGSNGTGAGMRTLIQFDVRSYLTSLRYLPSLCTINNVTLRMRNYSNWLDSETAYIYNGGAAWDEDTVTWNTKPSNGSEIYSWTASESDNYIYYINDPDLTSAVEGWRAGSSSAYTTGLIVRVSDSDEDVNKSWYAGSDDRSDASYKIYFYIDATVPDGAQNYDSALVGANSVVLYASSYESNVSPTAAQNHYYMIGANTSNLIQCGTTSSVSYTVDARRLITTVEIPDELVGMPAILYSVNYWGTQQFNFSAGAGSSAVGITTDDIYEDSRAFTKPIALSVIQSVSDNVDAESTTIQNAITSDGGTTRTLVSSESLSNQTLIRDASRYAAIAAGKLATDVIQWNNLSQMSYQDGAYAAVVIGKSLYPCSATFSAVVNRADTSPPVAPPIAGYNNEQASGITYATSAGTVNGVSVENHFLSWNFSATDQAGSYQMSMIEKDSSGNSYFMPSISITQQATPFIDTSGFLTSTYFDAAVSYMVNAVTNNGTYRAAIADTTFSKVLDPDATGNPLDLAVPQFKQCMIEHTTVNRSGGLDVQVTMLDYPYGLSDIASIWNITPGLTLEQAADEFGIAGDISIVTWSINIPTHY